VRARFTSGPNDGVIAPRQRRKDRPMNDNVTPTQTLAHATPETAKSVAGRRAFFITSIWVSRMPRMGRCEPRSPKPHRVSETNRLALSRVRSATGLHAERLGRSGVRGWPQDPAERGRLLMIPGGMRHNENRHGR